MNPNFAVVEI